MLLPNHYRHTCLKCSSKTNTLPPHRPFELLPLQPCCAAVKCQRHSEAVEQQKQVITFGLGDVDQPAEYLAHAWLEREVLCAASDGDDEVWGFQVPVLGHEIVECLRVCVA